MVNLEYFHTVALVESSNNASDESNVRLSIFRCLKTSKSQMKSTVNQQGEAPFSSKKNSCTKVISPPPPRKKPHHPMCSDTFLLVLGSLVYCELQRSVFWPYFYCKYLSFHFSMKMLSSRIYESKLCFLDICNSQKQQYTCYFTALKA